MAADRRPEAVRERRLLAQTPSEGVPLDLRVTNFPFEVEKEDSSWWQLRTSAMNGWPLQRKDHDVLNMQVVFEGYADYLESDSASDGKCASGCHDFRSLIEAIQSAAGFARRRIR